MTTFSKMKSTFVRLALISAIVLSAVLPQTAAAAGGDSYADRAGDCMLSNLGDYFACKRAASSWWERAKCEAQDASSSISCLVSEI